MTGCKTAAGILLAAALLIYPETALNAAREAMNAWYATVAPAMFPFMALMPMLTCAASARAWERMLGGLMQKVFRLPGAAAPALAVCMIAGSPAGAHAAVKCKGLSREQRARIIYCTCGLSPAFLITGIGAAMLNSPEAGRTLLAAQLAAQLTMLLITRGCRSGQPDSMEDAPEDAEPVRAAVANILAVCGYMVVFNTAAAVFAAAARSDIAGKTVLCLMDVPSAARFLAGITMNERGKIIAIAALAGFGGLCIAAQNLSAAKKAGVQAKKYVAARGCHALLNAGYAALMTTEGFTIKGKTHRPLEFSALILTFLLIPALISLKKDLFLNKRIFEKSSGK